MDILLYYCVLFKLCSLVLGLIHKSKVTLYLFNIILRVPIYMVVYNNVFASSTYGQVGEITSFRY